MADAPAYASLAAELRRQIICGDLQPGDQLPTELEVSARFRVSRNTAREAIRMLSSQGLVATRRGSGGGTFVAHPSTASLQESLHTGVQLMATTRAISVTDLIEVRTSLEVPITERAALRRTEADLSALQASLAPAADHDAAYRSHHAFHTALAQASHNQLYEVLAEPLMQIPLAERYSLTITRTAYWQQTLADHEEILAAVEAQDPIAAKEAAQAHLRHLRIAYSVPDQGGASGPSLGSGK